MPDNYLGQVRRSQILGYGPGAIIDFRAGKGGGAAVSVIAVGLEEWDKTAKIKTVNDPHIIYETRLQAKLGKTHFRLPPVDDRNFDNERRERWLDGIRFPFWLQCPKCGALKPASKWSKEIGDPTRWCAPCSAGGERVHAVPSRFVIACENGHIDDFPWMWWLRRKAQVHCTEGCQLALVSEGKTGLSGLVLKCIRCNARASMDGVFGEKALSGLGCHGKRPWLDCDESCSADMRALQRGASNLYFPVMASALSIPPWEDWLQQEIGLHWGMLISGTSEFRRAFVEPIARLHGKDVEKIIGELERRIAYIGEVQRTDLKRDEYLHFIEASDWSHGDEKSPEFSIVDQPVPSTLAPFFSKIVKVDRLREVRTQTAFKRIYQPDSADEPGRGQFGSLSSRNTDWLPAVEVRGEGIFLSFDPGALQKWETDCLEVGVRTARITAAFHAEWTAHGDRKEPPPLQITARFLLIHSFAHALIRQLALDCGYDAASLRERTYIGGTNPEMTGILIYTGSSDADGTLGGLARQAEPDRIEAAILGALDQAKWCSADPLCLGGITAISETYNIAACHSCILVPETSCEHFNRFLDRGLLVGDPETGLKGYFEDLLGER